MAGVKALCVYCGSSSQVDPAHLAAAGETGRLAAERGIEIVFGGGHVGMMGALADGALAAGGQVTGIIPEILRIREAAHREVTNMIYVDSMHTRKRKMFERSDAFCVLPGGMGTLDEMFEIVTWKQLGLHDKPVIVANVQGYWTPLLALIEHQIAGGYVRPPHTRLFRVVERVTSVFDALEEAPAANVPSASEQL